MAGNNLSDEKGHTITGVWSKHFSKDHLPFNVYHKTGKHLANAVKDGYKIKVKFGSSDAKLLSELTDNIWFFSAAKTYQQVRGMEATREALMKFSGALVDKEGNEISRFKAFRDGYVNEAGDFVEGASQIFDTFNEDWLRSEYNTVINKAYLAQRWDKIQSMKETLPYIQRDEIEDLVECEDCAAINGMTVAVDDPILDEYYDGLHFNCRGNWRQLSEEEGKDQVWTTEECVDTEEGLNNPREPMFKMNPGKDRIIFKTDGPNQHPYFEVAKGDRELKDNNFNLPKL
jgi:hypothetical protein